MAHARHRGLFRVIHNSEALKNARQAADLYRLEGEILVARRNAAQAIEKLAAADQHDPNGLTADSLARAYEAAGNAAQAVAWRENLLKLENQCAGWEAQTGWIAAHCDLAQAYAARGDKKRALELLDRFGRLWKNADPQLPLAVRAARLRASLQ